MMLARQNFAADCENALNQQINSELCASYVYLAMYAYFSRDGIALPGLAKFFKKNADEEREHAEKLINYVVQRGGVVSFHPISEPQSDVKSAKNALEMALQLEKDVNQSLLNVVRVGEANGDSNMVDFIEGEFLGEQVESIRHISDMITALNRAGNEGLGLYLFDKSLQ